VSGRDVRWALRVRVFPADCQRPARHVDVCVALLRIELGIDGLSDHFRHGNAEPLRPLPQPAMLHRRQLYLDTQHDGSTIPSSLLDGPRRWVAADAKP